MLSPEEIRSAVSETAAFYDIDRVYLFGSYARGTANDDSDVDLCLETGRTFSLFNAGAFSHALDKLLGVPIDMSTPDALYDFVKKPCLQERVLLYERV